MSKLRNFTNSALEKAEPIHYWVLSLSIILGGFWILLTFNILQERDKAQSELQSARTQLIAVKKQIEGVHSSYIQINEKLIELPVSDDSKQKFGLVVNVGLQNTGTESVDMHWGDTPLSIYKMAYRNGTEMAFKKTLSPQVLRINAENRKTHIQSAYLFSGAKKDLSFFVELEEEGLYYIVFEAQTGSKVTDKMDKIDKKGLWFASKYVYVEKEDKPKYETYIKASNVLDK
ncbi:hypothetical protein ABMX85_01455 [Vibrio vulnificus]|uniref:hypothetical protein n=1 Tax=Vibrio vulnificus TaxID=672 RepID=UPI00405A30E9